MDSIVDKILPLLNPDLEVVKEGRRRQEAIWEGYEPDFLPILIGGVKNLFTEAGYYKLKWNWSLLFPHGKLRGGMEIPEFDLFPHYNLKEQFYDKEKMLAEYLWALIAAARSKSDAQLSIRANHGVAIGASLFGAKYQVLSDSPPWTKDHMSIDRILHQDLSNIGEKGLCPRVAEFMNYYKRKLSGKAYVFLPLISGPFDLAYILRGNDIFTDMYDSPHSVFRIMEKTTEAFIKSNLFFKKVIDEPLTSAMSDSLYMASGGVRITEDSSILLSPVMWNKFVKPFVREALKPFGGGIVHFCGQCERLLDNELSIPEVRGVNLGQPELYDYGPTIKKFLAADKTYFGVCWPKRKDESIKEYFSRILAPLKGEKRCLIFHPAAEGDLDLSHPIEEGWPSPEGIIQLWHSLQERKH